MRAVKLATAAIVGAGLVGLPISAKDAPVADSASGGAVLDAVTRCRAIPDAAGRLACFDAAARALDEARTADGLVALNRADIRAKNRALFGFVLPRINLFGGKDDTEEIKQLDSKVRSVSAAGRGHWTLHLEDGSVWRITDATSLEPMAGETVRIKRAAMGSYLGNIGGRTALRMERAQ